MSQLQYNPIATGTVAASPSGLVRTSNVVTCTLTANVTAFEPPVATINSVPVVDYVIVDLTGLTSVNGNDFNGSFLAQSITFGSVTVLTWIDDAPDDTGGGGTVNQLNGFCDIPDSLLSGNQPLNPAIAQRLLHNGKFAAVRVEIAPLGFYSITGGLWIPPAVSAVDGYQYKRSECLMLSMIFSSRQAASGFVAGQFTVPNTANSDLGTGALVMVPQQNVVDALSGVLELSYQFGTTNTQASGTPQGTTLIVCVGQRLSVNPLN